jgi:hypothetical protein
MSSVVSSYRSSDGGDIPSGELQEESAAGENLGEALFDTSHTLLHKAVVSAHHERSATPYNIIKIIGDLVVLT